jgi:hypothetical protein
VGENVLLGKVSFIMSEAGPLAHTRTKLYHPLAWERYPIHVLAFLHTHTHMASTHWRLVSDCGHACKKQYRCDVLCSARGGETRRHRGYHGANVHVLCTAEV